MYVYKPTQKFVNRIKAFDNNNMRINRVLHMVLYNVIPSGTHTSPLLSVLLLSSPVSAEHLSSSTRLSYTMHRRIQSPPFCLQIHQVSHFIANNDNDKNLTTTSRTTTLSLQALKPTPSSPSYSCTTYTTHLVFSPARPIFTKRDLDKMHHLSLTRDLHSHFGLHCHLRQ